MKIIFSEINVYRSLSNIIIHLKIFSFRKPWFFKTRIKLRKKKKRRIKKKISFILKKIQKWVVSLTGLKTKLVIYRTKSLNLYPEMISLMIQKSFKQRKNFRLIFRKTIFHIQKRFKQGIVGAKIRLSGRLGKSQIARTEWIQSNNPFGGKSQLPLQTINKNITYSYKTIYSKRGTIGVKTWLFLRTVKYKKNRLYLNK
uniref:Ribosomal protein S3 n=1 Tax=Cyanophora biloba TaxID=1489483 RepID=A0A873WRK4_9EUKA|nr:ribosomal protein S3 [Cyanophora biloba]QPB15015.1 ribosomal protein S3 [Cyanophora biloba]